MDKIVDSGSGADALRLNQLYQTQTRQAYWVSGGDVTVGTSSTQIEVDVAAGEAQISGGTVSWADTSVALAASDNDPRVDVVHVQSDGSLAAVTGTSHGYRPNTDEDGNAFTPAPFEHWEPAPDDGANITGMPLACVLVKPSVADSTDLSGNVIQDRRLAASTQSEYVKGNGTDNGRVEITANDSDFVVKDETDSVTSYLWRDFDAGELRIGSPNAMPVLRESLDANSNDVTNVNQVSFADSGAAALDLTATGDGTKQVWKITDGTSSDPKTIAVSSNPGDGVGLNVNVINGGTLFKVDTDGTARFGGGDINANNGSVTDVNQVSFDSTSGPALDFRPNSTGTRTIWRHDDGAGTPTDYVAESDPAGGVVFRLENITDSEMLFRVNTDGTATLGGAAVATESWVSTNYYDKTVSDNQYVDTSGDTLSGNLGFGGNNASGVGELVFQNIGQGGSQRIEFGGTDGSLTINNTFESSSVASFSGTTMTIPHGVTFVSEGSANVPNRCLFLDTSNGTLSFKDNSGTVHALY